MYVVTLIPVGAHKGHRSCQHNFLFETRSHSNWSSLIWIDWLREPLGLVWVLLYWCYRQCASIHTWFVFGCWGSKLKSSCLCGRHWTYWAVLNSLFICVFLGNSAAQVSLDSSVFHSVFKVSVSGHIYLSLSLSGWLGRVLVIATWQGPGTGEMVFL